MRERAATVEAMRRDWQGHKPRLPRSVRGERPSAQEERDLSTVPSDGALNDSAPHRLIIVIDERALIRDCLAKCLTADNSRNVVLSYPSVEAWQADAARHPSAAVIVLYSSGAADGDAMEIEDRISAVVKSGTNVPVVVISDAYGTDLICDALKNGVRGYIPTTVTLNVAIEAMHLVQAGGVYIPADSLLSDHGGSAPATLKKSANGLLTGRQVEVVRAIRSGMTNKRIAYELKMSESTVKAHIRSIMKKLNVRNRTEVALYAGKGARRPTLIV